MSQINEPIPPLRESHLSDACELLRQSGRVALTHFEGRFILVGRAYDAQVAQSINEIKKRTSGRPLVMCFHDLKLIERAQLSSPLLHLLPRFQERITLSVPAPPNLPSAAHSGVGMVGVRYLETGLLNQVMRTLDEPLLISSANPTGRPAARHWEDLEVYELGALPLLGARPSDEGPSTLKRATVVGLVHSELQVLSPGDTALSEIKRGWEALKLSGEVW